MRKNLAVRLSSVIAVSAFALTGCSLLGGGDPVESSETSAAPTTISENAAQELKESKEAAEKASSVVSTMYSPVKNTEALKDFDAESNISELRSVSEVAPLPHDQKERAVAAYALLGLYEEFNEDFMTIDEKVVVGNIIFNEKVVSDLKRRNSTAGYEGVDVKILPESVRISGSVASIDRSMISIVSKPSGEISFSPINLRITSAGGDWTVDHIYFIEQAKSIQQENPDTLKAAKRTLVSDSQAYAARMEQERKEKAQLESDIADPKAARARLREEEKAAAAASSEAQAAATARETTAPVN